MTTRTSFPDINFFRITPTPLLATASPCTALPSHSAPPPPVASTAYPGPTSTSILQSDSTKEITPVDVLTSLESHIFTNTYQANHLVIMSTSIALDLSGETIDYTDEAKKKKKKTDK